jgi:hypothetical protein
LLLDEARPRLGIPFVKFLSLATPAEAVPLLIALITFILYLHLGRLGDYLLCSTPLEATCLGSSNLEIFLNVLSPIAPIVVVIILGFSGPRGAPISSKL